jgi:hypothetical protein
MALVVSVEFHGQEGKDYDRPWFVVARPQLHAGGQWASRARDFYRWKKWPSE